MGDAIKGKRPSNRGGTCPDYKIKNKRYGLEKTIFDNLLDKRQRLQRLYFSY